MKLESILIWNKLYESSAFHSDEFRKKLKSLPNQGEKIDDWIWIIENYKVWDILDLDSQVKVARAIVSLWIQAITDGEIDAKNVSQLESGELADLILFNQSSRELREKVNTLFQEALDADVETLNLFFKTVYYVW